ncbi:O-antigen ligase family protein [Luteimonas sp. 50]|uniref:O-antigen ligase family protein n=1 Tax=Cognatiluteimonas sedimenti TaxID=2927791 RepID=A0ABT0A581_9GAMM|nr:O-antigen ligase family protein [Lysobacter sedimenti]MCJ0826155.1 O-antigen ligase family protein [Lysobacter sedimenti]
MHPGLDRDGIARLLAAAALWCLPALALALPHGLMPFALLLLLSSALALPVLLHEARHIVAPLRAMALLATAVLALAVVSRQVFDLEWDSIDSRARLLLLPWCLAWAYALRPPMAALWSGAAFGLVAAFVVAVAQVAAGSPRAHGWSNPIVFAEVVLVLMVLVAFCRAQPRQPTPGLALLLALGLASIVLSGSRGAWPGVLLLLVAMAWGGARRAIVRRLLVIGAVVAAIAVLVLAVPALSNHARIAEFNQDISQYEQGNNNTSTGARLRLVRLAADAFVQHPLTGIGVDNFAQAVRSLPSCVRAPRRMLCTLDHAHNDLAEWAATLGIPGILAIFAIYALPLLWFVRTLRASGLRNLPVGSAWAGAMLVMAYVLCGLTQSLFKHQLTASLYAILGGILLGLCLREAESGRGGNPTSARVAGTRRPPRVRGAGLADDGAAASRPDIRVISRDNGVGLSRDLQLVAATLRGAGRNVDILAYGGSGLRNRLRELELRVHGFLHGPVPIQVFIERIYPRCLPAGRRNLLIPNPEWFRPEWRPLLPDFERVLCKTRHAVDIFDKLGCATRYIGFTSLDRLDERVPRERSFFHLAGGSQAKGTQLLLEAWQRHPEWPRLTVVHFARDASIRPPLAGNIDYRPGRMDDAALRRLQNMHAFHVCTSEVEGFGHALMEAMSTGAVVITTDGPPMNELVRPDRGLLVPPVRTGTINLALKFLVDVAGIENAVARALALDPQQLSAMSAAARRHYLEADAQFRANLLAALES